MSEHLAGDEASEPTVADVDEAAVRERAWEISRRADAGSPEENWRRAQEELRREQGQITES
jgi:hypothetical protein